AEPVREKGLECQLRTVGALQRPCGGRRILPVLKREVLRPVHEEPERPQAGGIAPADPRDPREPGDAIIVPVRRRAERVALPRDYARIPAGAAKEGVLG